MTIPPILGPAAVLALWSLVVLMWLVVTRFPAFEKAGMNLSDSPRGARYADVENEMPPKVNWVSHNYTHLMEQPTIFYAVVFIFAIAGDMSTINVAFAWGYVVLRIAHSLWQGLINTIPVRVGLFTLSTVCLFSLATSAVKMTLW